MASFLFLKFCLYWIKHGQDVFFLIDQINWKKPENHPDKKIKGKESLGKKIFFSLWKKMKKKKIWSLYTWRVFILASTWLRHYLNLTINKFFVLIGFIFLFILNNCLKLNIFFKRAQILKNNVFSCFFMQKFQFWNGIVSNKILRLHD